MEGEGGKVEERKEWRGKGRRERRGKCGGENHEDSTVHHPALLTPVYTLLHDGHTFHLR